MLKVNDEHTLETLRTQRAKRIPTDVVHFLSNAPIDEWYVYETIGGTLVYGRRVQWDVAGITGDSIEVIYNPEP